MFYRNEHYMSISHIALIVNMVHVLSALKYAECTSAEKYPIHNEPTS